MKKILISIFTIAAFIFYVAYQRLGFGGHTAIQTPNTDTSNSDVGTQTGAVARYRDGEYNGVSVDAYYGRVEVVAVVKNGQLVDVQFLDYPRDRSTSIEISGLATPILRTEAITAQSAEVDIVSGATETSKAFKESLASALVKARL